MKGVVVNTQVLNKKMQEYRQAWREQAKPMLYRASLKGAEYAATKMPPYFKNSESATIPEKEYKRKFLFIPALLSKDNNGLFENLYQGKLFEKKDKIEAEFKNGNIWLVVLEAGKKFDLEFKKDVSELKDKKRIKYRGLFRAMFGKKFLQQGFNSPVFAKLFADATDLRNSNQNELIYQKENEDFYSLANINKSGVPNFVKRPYIKKLKSALQSEVNKFTKKYFKNKSF